jgi:L-alanine-DL-glutamate epimerase-like enolase superfamily enzyme
MVLDKVNIYQVVLPFSIEFSHSLRKRFSAKNIIVEVIANHGEIKGYGEGAPRSYVTGESQESAAKSVGQILQNSSFPWQLNDVSQVWNFVGSITSEKEHNAAICAIETALLDALGKRENKSIVDFFAKDFYNSSIYYGATIPLANNQQIMEVCQWIKELQINELRLKIGKNFEQNKATIEAVRLIFGGNYDLRVDTNGAWNLELAVHHIPLIEEYNVKVIEQPLIPEDPDLAEFAGMIREHGVILMADESACSLEDVERIIKEKNFSMMNVRLSKCGGFQNSFRIIDQLRTNGLSFQIGCQLGESGILSAAGRALCLLCKDAIYYDGSYDRFMLKENITTEHVSFGPGGKAGPLDGPGLGVIINKESLMRLSNGSPSATISNPLS